ncbi:MAG TPA: flagellar protein FlaG [Deltaproteobacteria bacterium]|nr:flagellar protein FlaG [Deltaproteobacteria bacterium]HOM28854.1 flagellar protein FlaG [Deltaproteobacteria bacterium]
MAMKIESLTVMPGDRLSRDGPVPQPVAVSKPRIPDSDSDSQAATKPLQKDDRSADEMKKDIEAINEQLAVLNQSLQFRIDEESKDVVIRIVDKDSGEVIKQIPPEEIMNLRRRLREMSSLFVERTV